MFSIAKYNKCRYSIRCNRTGEPNEMLAKSNSLIYHFKLLPII